ncbi:hypothetical protein [Pseudoalteromonas phage XCL1123]|nr:hypothetical protein [Pseudoalteromonas phage XCL1123]
MNNKSEKAIKSIGRSIANINKQMELIREEFSEGEIYVEDGRNFNILSGGSHSFDADGAPNQSKIIGCFEINHAGCGGW